MKKKGVLIFLLILLTGFVAYSPMRQDKASASESTRSPFVSQLSKMGWYSSNQKILSDELDSYLANAKVNLKENVQALILPHAGYAYSGQTAAYGVKTL
ncbi:MAG: AmmeMemoRadiSam system protein B, partial [Candidatus Aureabacteria bacterium]|nr:AmmeMemoRadiSam system protein B [Candidatus Auribacterota bacterium]